MQRSHRAHAIVWPSGSISVSSQVAAPQRWNSLPTGRKSISAPVPLHGRLTTAVLQKLCELLLGEEFHWAPPSTKLCHRTSDVVTLDEVERIRI